MFYIHYNFHWQKKQAKLETLHQPAPDEAECLEDNTFITRIQKLQVDKENVAGVKVCYYGEFRRFIIVC